MAEPSPRDIAFRLLASREGGSATAADVISELALTVDDLCAVMVELVQIGAGAIGALAAEQGVSSDEIARRIERALDQIERDGGSGP